jgi:uncharacterized protein YggE
MMRMTLPAAAIACLIALFPLQASAQADGRMRIIGRAMVEVAPDYVTVNIGVSNNAPSPTAALDQNSAAARKIIDFAKTFGVEERDIQTGSISLSPVSKTVRDPSGATRQEPNGYAASNTVRVKLADLSRLGAFMRQTLDQGATNINGVNFGIARPEKATDEARALAVEDAVRQAERLAAAAKVKLGKIREIVHPPRGDLRAADGMANLPLRQASRMAVPVQAGALQISAEVEVTWTIE